MDGWLRQSTAVTIYFGPFVDDSDGKTPETLLTISQGDVILSKNGGAGAQKNDNTAASHDVAGKYRIALDATDTNTLGVLRVDVVEVGALAAWQSYQVIPAAVYDAMVTGSGNFPANVKQVSDDVTAADNLETAMDDITWVTTIETNLDAKISEVVELGVSDIASAVLDELLSGHETTGSLGRAIIDILNKSNSIRVDNITILDPYDAYNQRLTIYYGEDRTAASPNGALIIPNLHPSLDLLTAGTIKLSARSVESSTASFTITGTVVDGQTASFDLTTTNSKKLTAGGIYIWDAVHTTSSGLDTFFNGGKYVVAPTVTATT